MSKFLTKSRLGAFKKRVGAKPKYSKRTKSQIIRYASNTVVSAKKIKRDLGLPCSIRTIQRTLHDSSTLVYRKMIAVPKLTLIHRLRRMNWCRERMNWNEQWKKIIFSDEKMFTLDGPTTNQYCWQDVRKPRLRLARNHSGGGGVMVWGAIGWFGKSELVFPSSNLDSETYQNIIRDGLIPIANDIGGLNYVFVQDNAPAHTASSTRVFLATNDIELSTFPAKSPDLNIIENLWGILSQAVYANGKQYTRIMDLKLAIQIAWANLSVNSIQSLYNSIPNRLKDVISRKGDITKY